MEESRDIAIVTGGGDTPGQNAALYQAVITAAEQTNPFVRVFGFLDGWQGVIENRLFKDGKPMVLSDVDGFVKLAGSKLRTSRLKPEAVENPDFSAKIALRLCPFDGVLAIGGDDTLTILHKILRRFSQTDEMAKILSSVSVAIGASLLAHRDIHTVPDVLNRLDRITGIGVPKTMDGDLSGTDTTFGKDTVVNYYAREIDQLYATASSMRRVIVFEVFGRHSGFTALETGAATEVDWVGMPEFPLGLEAMVEHLNTVYREKSYGFVVVSEGVEDPDLPTRKGQVDKDGHPILKSRAVGEALAEKINELTGIETRAVVPGHLARTQPPTVFDRHLARITTRQAISDLIQGMTGMMIGIRDNRIDHEPLEYAVKRKQVEKEHPLLQLLPKAQRDFLKL